jgi:hypothetical protein
MKIQLPFIYFAEVVVGRRKNSETLNYLGIVNAEIREISASMAPVAVTWNSNNSGDLVQEVRVFDGGFYAPASRLQRDAKHFPASKLTSVALLDDNAARGIADMLGIPLGDQAWNDIASFIGPSPKAPPQAKDIKTLVSSGEETSRATAEEVANGLVSINGILFKRIEEPVIAVAAHARNGAPEVLVSVHMRPRRYAASIDLDQGIKVADPHNTRFFPLTEMVRALDAAHSFGVSVDVRIDGEPEVLIPSVITYDAEFDAALRTAEWAVEGLKAGIGKFNRQVIETWVDIRERRKVYLETGNREIIEDLASDALPRLHELMAEADQTAATALETGLGDWSEGTINVAMFGEGMKR